MNVCFYMQNLFEGVTGVVTQPVKGDLFGDLRASSILHIMV